MPLYLQGVMRGKYRGGNGAQVYVCDAYLGGIHGVMGVRRGGGGTGARVVYLCDIYEMCEEGGARYGWRAALGTEISAKRGRSAQAAPGAPAGGGQHVMA